MDADWDLLPDEPERFFGLQPGFDPLELKRAYGALIKRYKPERFPEEFQRIRAAYELVQQRLAAPQPVRVRRPRRRSPSVDPAPNPLPEAPVERDALLDDPERAYAELARLERREPRHYRHLALASEHVRDPLGQSFAGWLVAGLCEYPHDRVLALWLAFSVPSIPEDQLEGLIAAAEPILARDATSYYALTVELWTRWIATAIPERFCARIDALESDAPAGRESESPQKLWFLLRCLRPASWRADRSWCTHKLAWLEERHREITGMLEQELEFLTFVHAWIGRRAGLVCDQPLLARLDEIVRALCLDDPRLDTLVLELARDVVGRRAPLWRGLTFGAPLEPQTVTLWRWTVAQLEPRLLSHPPYTSSASAAAANSLAREELLRSRWRGVTLLQHLTVMLVHLTGITLCYVAMALIGWIGELVDAPSGVSDLFAVCTIVPLYWFLARPRWLTPLTRRAVRVVLRWRYALSLRRPAAELLASSGFEPKSLSRELHQLGARMNHGELQVFAQLVSDDPALSMIAWLRPFVR